MSSIENKIIIKAVEYNFATKEFKITLFNESFNEYYNTTAPAELFNPDAYDLEKNYFK